MHRSERAAPAVWQPLVAPAAAPHLDRRWYEAEEMYRELLEVQRRVLGEDYPDTLRTASKPRNMGRFG